MASSDSVSETPSASATRNGRVDDSTAPMPIVGIGASAGGVDALRTFFQHLPAAEEEGAGASGALLATDDNGFVLTGKALTDDERSNDHSPEFLETSRPGVFAAGDVRSGSVKRVASAVGEGSMSVKLVHEFLARIP